METKKFKILFSIFLVVVGLYAIVMTPFFSIPMLGAVLTQGILGPGRNKVGGVIMSKWKSIDYIRGYAIPSNPNTSAQQTVRAKHSALVDLAHNLMPYLIPTFWDPFYNTMSGFNAFYKENYSLLDVNNKVTLSNITSKGTLAGTLSIISAIYTTGSGNIAVDWDSTLFGNALSSDDIGLTVIDKTTNEVIYSGTPAESRSENPLNVTGLSGKTATNLIAYLTFHRGVGSEFICSDSQSKAMTAA